VLRRWVLTAFMATAPMLLAAGFLTAGTERAEACACCGSWQVINVASYDVLNIRRGPGTRHSVVGTMKNGTTCIILKGPRRGNWVKIGWAEFDGWVNRRYLRYFDKP